MTQIRRITGIVADVLEVIVAIFFAVILAVTLILVFLRYGFNTSIKGGYELTNYLFIYTTAIGASVAVNRRQHITIDFFINMLKGVARKVADIVVHLLIAGINVLILLLSVNWIRQVGSFQSPVLRIPNWMVEVIVPVGAAFTILFCISTIIQDVIGGTELEGTFDAVINR